MKYYSISEMAHMHGISRQTLIYYDKIGLFSPSHVSENGSRLYTVEQMPFLREICFLKELNLPLKEIKEHINQTNSYKALELIQKQLKNIRQKQAHFRKMEEFLLERLNTYEQACIADVDGQIYLRHKPRRHAIMVRWERAEMNPGLLHLCYVKGKKRLEELGVQIPYGLGAKLSAADVRRGGSLFFLPGSMPQTEDMVIIPEGLYACTYVYGKPYQTQQIRAFAERIGQEHMRTTGDYINVCLLDTVFHSKERPEDLCELQIKIEEKTINT